MKFARRSLGSQALAGVSHQDSRAKIVTMPMMTGASVKC